MSKINIKDYVLVTNKGTVNFIDNKKFMSDWFGYCKRGGESGVYMIGNYYIGRSNDIRKRILTHCRKALSGNHYNDALSKRLMSDLKSGIFIGVKVISENVSDEYTLIRHYLSNGTPLLNSHI